MRRTGIILGALAITACARVELPAPEKEIGVAAQSVLATHSCPEYEGVWRSSKQETIEFTNKWVNVESKTMEFYSQIFGMQEIDFFRDKFVIADIPKRKITIDGNSYDWGGEGESVPYMLLGCTSNQVVIKYVLYGLEWIEVLNFVDENKYWVYTGSPNLDSSHTREFYVRQ